MLPTATQSFCILHINVLYIFVLERISRMKGFLCILELCHRVGSFFFFF